VNQKVVSNSGPLMALSKLNILHLLEQLYGQVFFPQAVYDECVTNGVKKGYTDAFTLKLFLNHNGWGAEKSVKIQKYLSTVNLDRGEIEAISLAASFNALLLMDEEKGRAVAREMGIQVKGTLGVLIQSFRRKLINENQLRFYFQQIGEYPDIWISQKLCKTILEKEL